MSYKVVIHPAAARDAEEAYLYIAQRSPENAWRWYDGLIDAMFSLADFPGRCPIAPESHYLDEEIRHLIHGNYRILFTIEKTKKAVRILHVRHGARRALGEDSSEA
jgi:plasmid stabilization system protein ParE